MNVSRAQLSAKAACVVLGCYGLDCTEGHLEVVFGQGPEPWILTASLYPSTTSDGRKHLTKVFRRTAISLQDVLVLEAKRDAVSSVVNIILLSGPPFKQTNIKYRLAQGCNLHSLYIHTYILSSISHYRER